MECGFKLKTDLKDEKGFSADIAIGSGANSMDKLESGYQKTDIKVRNNDGNAIDMSKAVKVTGKVSFSDDPTYTSGPVCYMKVYKIEQ
jgi:pimeloyl-CoA synthetase